MPDFGDITDDDVVDTATADPEAAVRILLAWRAEHAPHPKHVPFDDENDLERALWVFAMAALLRRFVREHSA